jgi:hypothetical protein
MSLIVEYLITDTIPKKLNLIVPQLSLKGPVTTIIGAQSATLNGEKLFGSDESNVAAFDNLFNPDATPFDWYFFKNPINLSRIRDISINGTYIETLNVLSIQGTLAGLLF